MARRSVRREKGPLDLFQCVPYGTHCPPHPIFRFLWHNAALADAALADAALADAEPLAQWFLGQGGFLCLVAFDGISKFERGHTCCGFLCNQRVTVPLVRD